MAVFSGTVTVNRSWEVGDRNGKTKEISKDLTITLTAQGGGTNTIGKTALGFTSIYTVVCLLFVDGSVNSRVVNLFTDGTSVFVADPQVVTDANRGLAADVTGTLTFRITGWIY